jgi:hypothetical protein
MIAASPVFQTCEKICRPERQSVLEYIYSSGSIELWLETLRRGKPCYQLFRREPVKHVKKGAYKRRTRHFCLQADMTR